MTVQTGSVDTAALAGEDAVAAAMRELGKRIETLRRWLLLPAVALSFVAAALGWYLHNFGYWSVLPRANDGSYLVGLPTFAVTMLLPAVLVFVPPYGLYRVLRRRVRARWLIEAAEKFGVPRSELQEMVSVFT